jgi:hypothetical protein
MNPKLKLTDGAVAELPLHHGRAELLEEILRTPVLDDRPVRRTERPRRRTTWVVPVAAAAAVVALVAGSAWLVSGLGLVGRDGDVAGSSSSYLGALDAPGWTVGSVVGDDESGESTYVKGDQTFQIDWYPADERDGYVEDRRHITGTAVDGEPIEVLGRSALMWAYDETSHTAICEVENGHWLELRGDGMSEAAYLDLLAQVRLVEQIPS